jgi:hypothetical protein
MDGRPLHSADGAWSNCMDQQLFLSRGGGPVNRMGLGAMAWMRGGSMQTAISSGHMHVGML